jgi:hypothetical protein
MMSGENTKTKRILPKLWGTLYFVSAILIVVLLGAVPVVLGFLNLKWAAPFLGFLLVIALMILNIRSEIAAKVFEKLRLHLLMPTLKEVISHQKELHQCRTVLKRMESTLDFFGIWGLRDRVDEEPESENHKKSIFGRLKAKLRWDRLVDFIESDPEKRTPQLPDGIAQDLVEDETRIASCSERAAIYLFSSRKESEQTGDRTTTEETGLRSELSAVDESTWALILELLYRELHGSEDFVLWSSVREDEPKIASLLAVLLWSEKLPPPEEDLPYIRVSLQHMISAQEMFSLEGLRKQISADQQRRRKNLQIVEKMVYVLKFYTLYPHLVDRGTARRVEDGYELRESFRRELIDKPNGEGAVDECANLIAGQILDCDRGHIKLLFLERHAFPHQARELWSRRGKEVEFRRKLCQILLDSRRLPEKEPEVAYTDEELQELLNPDDCFHLDFSLDNIKSYLVDDVQRRRENRQIARRMDHALRFYGLDSLEQGFQNKLTDLMKGDDLEKRWARCAELVSEEREGNPSANTLLLLYLERHENAQLTNYVWNKHKNNPNFINELAMILLDSQRLPEVDDDLPLDQAGINQILSQLVVFSLEQVRDEVFADQEWRNANRLVVDGILATVDYFNLGNLIHTDRKEMRRNLIDTPRGEFRTRKRVEFFTDKVATSLSTEGLIDLFRGYSQKENLPKAELEPGSRLRKVTGAVVGSVIKLLYLEHGRRTQKKRVCWHDERSKEDFQLYLATLLMYSGQLPKGKDYLPFGINDLQRLLISLVDFSLPLVVSKLDQLNQVWQRCQRYRGYLRDNNLRDISLNVEDILDRVITPEGLALETKNLTVMKWMGERAIRFSYPDKFSDILIFREQQRIDQHVTENGSEAYDSLVRTLSLVSLIIFITEKATESLSVREELCRQVSISEKGPYVVSGYLSLREQLRHVDDLGGRTFLDVDFLISSWAEKVYEEQQRLRHGFFLEIEAITNYLKEGEWLQRVPNLLNRTYKNIHHKKRELFVNLDRVLDQRPKVRDILEMIFRKMSIGTISRYLESKKHIAYLLHFRVGRGTLAYLIDCLSSPNREKTKQLESIGVQLGNGEQRLYNFVRYTNSARIGIVPTGWTFEQFFDTFQDNLRKVIANREMLLTPSMLEDDLDKLDNIEIILSKFMLAGENQHWFRYDEYTKDRAKERVRDLFAKELKDPELTTLIEYEGYEEYPEQDNLADVVMSLSISQVIAGQLQLNNLEKQILNQEDTKIKQRLVQNTYDDIHHLGRVVKDDRAGRRQAMGQMRSILAELEEFKGEKKEHRRKTVAREYIGTLAAVAQICY